ncbi:hypothetical protein ACFYO2_18770 [Streptomyces sp. NPDC006602]|uniref:hypothetical protein n=1 Tax=Streptomyces sp. NPDC006602 TaxID=3364751 RepID=UPI0036AB0C75
MRLPKPVPVSLCLAAAAVFLSTTPAYADSDASCVASGDRAFPVTTRIHGGPDSYEAGGGYGTWYLDLTNTTTRTCAKIHPVVVLADDRRALEPSQPRLEFYDGTARGGTRPHPVRFERTDADELVGAFADERAGFAGFTVGPGRTLTVKVRFAVTSDAVPNEVTANAAVVQRHDDDGDWIGQSNDYRFGIDARPSEERDREEAGEGEPERSPSAASTDPATGRLPFTDKAYELAATGRPVVAALAATALLLLTGATLLAARRRR